ncbi:hypothetical protein Ddc_17906 [Ditylenchus destructor]|nr:hypothetical protein Ddc_17906 [Ditylenchus destructor]
MLYCIVLFAAFISVSTNVDSMDWTSIDRKFDMDYKICITSDHPPTEQEFISECVQNAFIIYSEFDSNWLCRRRMAYIMRDLKDETTSDVWTCAMICTSMSEYPCEHKICTEELSKKNWFVRFVSRFGLDACDKADDEIDKRIELCKYDNLRVCGPNCERKVNQCAAHNSTDPSQRDDVQR